MSLRYRQATEADMAGIAFGDAAAFAIDYTAQDLQDLRLTVDPVRFLVAEDAGEIIGATGDFLFDMTVPGGSIPVPGVTWVSVRSTHRRRGILRELMNRQLASLSEQGFAAAVLTASEGGIYRRFGYGAATQQRKAVIELGRTRILAVPEPAEPNVRLVTAEQARAAVSDIHARWRATVPGALSRSEAWWDQLFLDRPANRDGRTSLFFLVHPDGYVSYRAQRSQVEGFSANICHITDFAAVTPKAHRALWSVLLGMDLFASIETDHLALDDPLPHLLSDPRQVRTRTLRDGLWVRPLDVARLLAARRYGIDIDVVLQVRDELFGDGRYHLTGGRNGAACTVTTSEPDITLPVDVLGSIYLGGHRAQALAAAGLLTTKSADGLALLDRAFLADRLPQHGTAF